MKVSSDVNREIMRFGSDGVVSLPPLIRGLLELDNRESLEWRYSIDGKIYILETYLTIENRELSWVFLSPTARVMTFSVKSDLSWELDDPAGSIPVNPKDLLFQLAFTILEPAKIRSSLLSDLELKTFSNGSRSLESISAKHPVVGFSGNRLDYFLENKFLIYSKH